LQVEAARRLPQPEPAMLKAAPVHASPCMVSGGAAFMRRATVLAITQRRAEGLRDIVSGESPAAPRARDALRHGAGERRKQERQAINSAREIKEAACAGAHMEQIMPRQHPAVVMKRVVACGA